LWLKKTGFREQLGKLEGKAVEMNIFYILEDDSTLFVNQESMRGLGLLIFYPGNISKKKKKNTQFRK
jgi:hypothetical protein